MPGASSLVEETSKWDEAPARRPGDDWITLVRKSGTPEFASAFAANPVLYTSVLAGPCVGVDAIATIIDALEAELPPGAAPSPAPPAAGAPR